jgi:hypothetical protein
VQGLRQVFALFNDWWDYLSYIFQYYASPVQDVYLNKALYETLHVTEPSAIKQKHEKNEMALNPGRIVINEIILTPHATV